MKNLKIKNLIYLLVSIGSIISIAYIYYSSSIIKENTLKALNLESINKAYVVTKQLSSLNDKIAFEYQKYDNDLRESLKIAQQYLSKNSRDTSLEVLKKQLDNKNKMLSYEIYLINKNYVIKNTTFIEDMDLDFHILPEVMNTLNRVYNNKDYVDLSSVINDSVTNRYKKYILQRAKDEDYIIQISFSVKNVDNIDNFISYISKELPSLIDTKIYTYSYGYSGEIRSDFNYNKKDAPGEKKTLISSKDLYDELLYLFEKDPNYSEDDFHKYINTFAKSSGYKDRYFYKDGKYIHRILMPFYSYINANENTVYLASIELDESAAKDTVEMLNILSYAIWCIVFTLTIIAIFILKSRIIQPLELLQLSMKNKEPVNTKSLSNTHDEISSIAITYNNLLENLKREILSNEELLEEFKDFTANTIHQVRTPVSVIKIALEMIKTTDEDVILQIKASLIAIEHMYDSLSYALHHEHVNFAKEKLNLSDLVKQRVGLFSTIAKAYDTKINFSIEDNLLINMNVVEAEYLIDNNLSNCIKYGTVGKDISVSLNKVDTNIFLSFSTYGKKIEDTKIIFNRYHRENNDKKGHGIGLHMVDTICKNNDILIQVDYFSQKNKFVYFFNEYVT